ncbi:protein NRT1/ PTR FAMILY 7.3-like isoform X2 [Asparagus officinalis]|nr:protein NRT1/ PTR FAMILY 7.3-like isoform X2 [Asparagus officinalis]
MGTVNLFSLVGAFLSDAYLGRYRSCAIFQSILTLGLVMLSLTTSYLLLKPSGCGKEELQCDPHSEFELAMFYLSIYLVAFGNGAGEPSIATFGTDQFDEEHEHEKASKNFFYSYFYVATNIGSLFSETILAYLQNLGHWALGFWVSAGSALFALVVFLGGSFRYRHFRRCGNPVARFFQVIFAAWKKLSVEIPAEDGLYEIQGADGANNGGRRIHHTSDFKFLDHAAIITSKDKINPTNQNNQHPRQHNPWQLCTVTQVEEVKCVFRLLPIWICTITFSGTFVQMVSLFIEQGASMKTTIYKFHIPPASMTVFDILISSTFIIFYKKLIAPFYTKLTKTIPKGPSDLRKMGYGLIFAMAGMLTAGFVEIHRKKYALEESEELSSLFILWQIPQYVLLGIGEAFVYVSQLDFFGSQVPDVMRSLGIGLSLSSISLGSYFCSLVLTVAMKITTKEGDLGWIPANLNDGFMERYFFLMTVLTGMELVLYIWFARRYKSISLERREDVGMENEMS